MPRGKGNGSSLDGLTSPQKEGVQKLARLIRRLASGAEPPTEEERYGMFGLFGARGSGKSTVLKLVLDSLAGDSPAILVCRPAFDCIALPREIPLGLSLTSHVKRFVDRMNDPGKLAGGAPAEARVRFDDAWQRLVERYVETDRQHRELQLSLAITLSEYQDIAAHEIESRATLFESVTRWIDSALALCTAIMGIAYEQILVALEDSDLGTGRMSLRGVSTFLDELRDPRLMFIVVADEGNLEERLRTGSDKDLSEHMVPQVLAKMVPVRHRVYLDPWDHRQALDFRPLARHPDRVKAPPLEAVLEERLREGGAENPLQVRDLTLLLPRYPRGLSDFYRGLADSAPAEDKTETAPVSPTDAALVLLLARARGDLSMARNLPLRPLAWWGLHLHWPPDIGGTGTWGQLIDKAWAGRPLWTFAPLKLPFELQGEEDAVLWAELLLNISFRRNPDSIRTFLRRFPPLAAQLSTCRFRYKPTPFELVRLGQMPHAMVGSPWLLWRGTGRQSAEIEAGWTPIVERSIGQPRSGLAEILKDLGVASLEPIGDDEAKAVSGILPADVRSLLLLTDKMAKLPWSDLAGWAEAQSLFAWPPLIAVFCGEAYLATLHECLEGEEPSERSVLQALDSLRSLAAEIAMKSLKEGPKAPVRQGLTNLLREIDRSPLLKSVDHPMAAATRAFFTSAAVSDLVAGPPPSWPPAAAD